jgi:sulfur-oxidizing protein SoxX
LKALLAVLLAGFWTCTIAQPALPEAPARERGDPARGRAIVVNRQLGLCLLCHSGPFPEEASQGDLAPDLRGTGSRWTEAQLRQRLVDPTQLNAATMMPAYGRSEGLWRVAPALRGQALLTPAQIEDVVAFLATLRD